MGTGSGNTVLYSEILVKNQMSGVLALLRQVRWLKTRVQSQNLLWRKRTSSWVVSSGSVCIAWHTDAHTHMYTCTIIILINKI